MIAKGKEQWTGQEAEALTLLPPSRSFWVNRLIL